MLKIICNRSKKTNKLYYALINCDGDKDVFVTFDIDIMCKLLNCDKRDIYLLDEGECIIITCERS